MSLKQGTLLTKETHEWLSHAVTAQAFHLS
jgi:hypothetical protein